jgi:hypothetical protein
MSFIYAAITHYLKKNYNCLSVDKQKEKLVESKDELYQSWERLNSHFGN